MALLVEPAAADSIIRVIGDKSASTNSDGEPIARKSPTSSNRESNTIRIIGDKPVSSQTPTNDQIAQPKLDQPSPPQKEIEAGNNKVETVEIKAPAQPPDVEETAEEQLTQRLAAIKAEEERKALEKAEQERAALLKIEQENEAARQAAIKLERDQLAARKAEESRIAAEKAELIRVENERKNREKAVAEEERLAAARKAVFDKVRLETDPVTTSVNRFEPRSGTESATDSTLSPPAAIWDLYLAAKANDPALGRTESRVTGSKADSDIVFSGLLPHLNSTAGVKQISQSLSDYGATNSNSDFTSLNYNVTAQMTLLNVPAIYSLSAAAAAVSAEQAGVAAARQNLIVKFTDSYFALLKAQTDKQIALGEINRLQQVLEQSQAFLKAGTGDIISVYEAQSRLDSAGADLTKSESNLRLAEQKLSSQVGKPVIDIVNYIPKQPAGPDPDNVDWWVATMEKEQPTVRQAREAVSQTSEQRKAAKSEYLPVLQASGGYDVNRGTAALPTAEVRQWFVGANLSLPIYSGGETSAKIRRATASEEERRHVFDETLDQQKENVKQAFFNLRYNISLIKALDQRKASAEIQLAAVKKGRKIGTRNAIDVLNAEQSYSMALRDFRYALYDNIIRVIQLKSAAGILAETDVSGLAGMEAPTPGNGLNLIISLASR
jgi:outer membrane protein